MNCNKRNRRGLNTIFEYYDCDNCKYHLEDESIVIGNDEIRIYYMSNDCILDKDKKFINNAKGRVLIKDIISDGIKNKDSKNIFLWLDRRDDLHLYYDIFTYFIDNNYHIFIVI